MKKTRLSFFLLLSLLTISALGARAETKSEIAFNDELTIPWGYLYQINRETPAKDTTVFVTIASTELVDFFVADEGDTDLYIDGGSIYVYIDERDIDLGVFEFVLEEKQLYEFVVENTLDHLEEVTVDVLIEFEYEGGSYFWILWVVLGIVGVGGIIGVISYQRRKQQQQAFDGQPSYQIYQTPDPYSRSTPLTSTVVNQNYCNSCGQLNDDNAKFCTNCGYQMSK